MKTQQISSKQLMFLLITGKTTVLLVYSAAFVPGIKNYLWLAEFLSHVIQLLLLVVVYWHVKRYSQQSFFAYTAKLLGKPIGWLVNCGYILFFLLSVTVLVREVSEIMKLVFFPNTPLLVFLLSFMLLVMLGARYGVDSIARSNDVLVGLIFVFITFIYVSSLFGGDLSNLLPAIDHDQLIPTVHGALRSVTTAFALPVLMFLYPQVKNKENTGQHIAFAFVVTMILSVLYAVVLVVVYSTRDLEQIVFPGFMLVRLISIGGFVERIDSIGMFVWVCSMYVKLATHFWISVTGLSYLVKVDYRKLCLPLAGIITVFSALWFNNLMELTEFSRSIWIVINATFIIVLPVLLSLISWIKVRWGSG